MGSELTVKNLRGSCLAHDGGDGKTYNKTWSSLVRSFARSLISFALIFFLMTELGFCSVLETFALMAAHFAAYCAMDQSDISSIDL